MNVLLPDHLYLNGTLFEVTLLQTRKPNNQNGRA